MILLKVGILNKTIMSIFCFCELNTIVCYNEDVTICILEGLLTSTKMTINKNRI